MHWDSFAHAVGARIRRLRKAAGLTIEGLADKAGTGAVYLGNVERGTENPSLKVLAGLAGALGVGVAQLVDVEADMDGRDARKELRARLSGLTPEDAKLLLRLLDTVRSST